MNLLSILLCASASWMPVGGEVDSYQRIEPPNPNPFGYFGIYVDADGEFAIVGSRNTQNSVGSLGLAYLYRHVAGAWTLVQTIQPPSGITASFGASVAIEGSVIAIGAPDDTGPFGLAESRGAVMTYAIVGGQAQPIQKVVAPDGSDRDLFGKSFALDETETGMRLAVGAPRDLTAVRARGSVYVFDLDASGIGWTFADKILPSDPNDTNNDFGNFVALEADQLVVLTRNRRLEAFQWNGEYFDPDGIVAEPIPSSAFLRGIQDGLVFMSSNEGAPLPGGAVQIYRRDTTGWSLVDLLQAQNPTVDNGFGRGVSIDGTRLLVGISRTDTGPSGAIVFERDSQGTYTQQLELSSDENGAFVGAALTGDQALLGLAPAQDQSGFLLAYDLDRTLGSATCQSNANSTGVPSAAFASGSPEVACNDVTLGVTELPAGSTGYFLMSLRPDFVPLFGSSQGNLCLLSPILRFSSSVLVAGADGKVSLALDLTQLPQGTTLPSGTTAYFQYWHRDANPGPTSNTSSGLRIDFE